MYHALNACSKCLFPLQQRLYLTIPVLFQLILAASVRELKMHPKRQKSEEAQVTKSIAQVVFESADETLQVPGLDDLSPH